MARSVVFALLLVACATGCQYILGIDDIEISEGSAGTGADGMPPGPPPVSGTMWWNQDYAYRRWLTLIGGAPEPDFPVLLRLSSENIDYGAMLADGADLRFVAEDNATELPHEIESWNRDGASEIWVRVPQMPEGGGIYMYYGNPDPPASSSPSQVWANGHIGVYHFADALPDSGDPVFANSAAPTPIGTGRNGLTALNQQPSQIGLGLRFDDAGVDIGQHVDFGVASEFNVEVGDQKTIELWFRTTTSGRPQHVFFKEGSCIGWNLVFWDEATFVGRYSTDGCEINNYHLFADTNLSDGQWHHVAFVIDRKSSYSELYIDGMSHDRGNVDNQAQGSVDHATAMLGTDWDGNEPFIGEMDELRVSSTVRSPAGIAAQYRMVANPAGDVWQLGDEELR